MNVEVSKDKVVILQESNEPHENEYNITECHFTFDDFTDSFQVKRAIFTILSTNEMYETDIINNKCNIPIEVLKHEYETVKLGVYGYNIGDNEELLNRFSPSYATFVVPTGSYEEGALSPEIITPSQYDIYSKALQEGLQEVDDKLDEVVQTVDEKLDEVDETMQQVTTDVTDKLNEVDETMQQVTTDVTEKLDEVDDKLNEVDTKVDEKIDEVDNKITEVNASIAQTNNLNLDVSDKIDGDVTVTLTKKDASTKTVILSDGTSLQFDWDGTKLGIKTDDEQEYTYVDLQGIQGPVGPQGEPFRIKKTYPSVSAMNADFNNMEYGDYVMIASSVEIEDNAKLYTRGEVAWIFITDFSGATGIRGETGLTPNIQIGTVVSGSTPNVTRTGTNENPIFNFTLVKGDTGPVGPTGPTGNGIASIEKTSTSGLVDTYTITFTNTNTTTFNVTNGNGIDRIEKTNTVDNVDTYTIYFTNGSTTTYEVTNGEVTEAELQAEVERLEMIYNAFPTVSDEDNEIQLNNTAKVTFKELGLKGDTSQEVIQEEVGTSVSDTSIYADDVDTDKENTIKLSGNTYQDSTTGKNLWGGFSWTRSSGGINFAQNSDGSINANGVSTTSVSSTTVQQALDNNYYKILQPGTYTVSGGISQYKYVEVYDNNATRIARDNGTGDTFTITEQTIVIVRLTIANSQTINNETFYVQLESGSTATDWEKFTNGASPNPDYPQEIEVVKGTQNIFISGKNIFNITDYTTFGNVLARNGNATFTTETNKITITTGANSANSGVYIRPITNYIDNYNSNREYIVSFDIKASQELSFKYGMSATAGEHLTIIGTTTTRLSVKEKLLTNSGFVFYSTQNRANDTIEISNIMVSLVNDTTFEPYHTNQVLPINLGDTELCKIGDYQDKIYKQNDKWYLEKNTDKIILNGNESIDIFSVTGGNLFRFKDIAISVSNISTVSNYFIGVPNSSSRYDGTVYYNYTAIPNHMAFDILTTKFTTIDEFRSWLSTHNTELQFAIPTPTTTEITDTTLVSQLNALYNANIYPITNINTDTSNLLPYIDLHYNFVTPSPSPSRPSQVNVVKGNNTITISNSDNTESQTYPINLPTGMELCKIGTYQDYIYESNGNWFKKENIKLATDIIGSTSKTISDMVSNATVYSYCGGTVSGTTITYSSELLVANTIYYPTTTPTDTQITDTTLITQLNNIKKAYSYDTQTNISQTNTDKPFIIYAEAIRSLKDIFQEVNNG